MVIRGRYAFPLSGPALESVPTGQASTVAIDLTGLGLIVCSTERQRQPPPLNRQPIPGNG